MEGNEETEKKHEHEQEQEHEHEQAKEAGPTETGIKNPVRRKKVPFYLNWQLWLVLSISLMAVTVGLVITFGPVVIIAPVVVIAAVVGGTAGPVIGAWEKVNERLKDVRERAEQAEEKALIAGWRNSEIEKKADRAAGAAVTLANRVDVNAERSDLLEKRYEALSDMAYQLTENLQQERAEARLITAELKAQNSKQQQEINWLKESHEREIAELKEQIRLMGVEKFSDKEKIVKLESQVRQLQEQVKALQERESVLVAENDQLIQANYDLRSGLRRRITDTLPGLTPDAAEKLKKFENEKKTAQQQLQEEEEEEEKEEEEGEG